MQNSRIGLPDRVVACTQLRRFIHATYKNAAGETMPNCCSCCHHNDQYEEISFPGSTIIMVCCSMREFLDNTKEGYYSEILGEFYD